MTFYEWLKDQKGLSHFSSKDILSRCNRVRRLVDSDEICSDTITQLNDNTDFNNLSKFVKSQLRRSVNLYLEYKERKEE